MAVRTIYFWKPKRTSLGLPISIIPQRGKQGFSDCEKIRKRILENTEVTNHHMTPELKLHLITRNCKLWWSKGNDSPFCDPYWAFYWPGGQVITRYIFDNPGEFKDKFVVDIGAGCGAAAIAAARTGARRAVANDVDQIAGIAAKMNAELNNALIEIDTDNLISQTCKEWDVVLLGDMFYDITFANTITHWVARLLKNSTEVLIGDPGRLPLLTHPMKKLLSQVAEYTLPSELAKENNGFTTGTVWKLKR